MKPGKIGYMSIRDLLMIVGVYLLINIVLALGLIGLSFSGTTSLNDLSKILSPVVFLLLILFIQRYRKKGFLKCGIVPPPLRFGGIQFSYVLIGYVVIIAADNVIDPLMNLLSDESIAQYYKLFAEGDPIVSFVVAVLMAPVLEEIVFRGYLLSDMSFRYGIFRSVLFTSLVFGLIHFSLVQSFPATITGMIIGFIYFLSGKSLSTVIGIHFLNNCVAFFKLMYFPRQREFFFSEKLFSAFAEPMVIQMISWSILLLFGLWIYFRLFRSSTKTEQ